MKKYTAIAALMTLMVAITLTVVGSSYAAQQNNKGFNNQRAEVQKAIESNDYNTWKSLVEQRSNSRFSQSATKDNFNKVIEQHKVRDQVQTAIKNGDYNTWKSLIAKTKRGEEMLKVINNEVNFKKFVEAHKLLEEGRAKIKQGHDKMNELGLKRPDMGNKKFSKNGVRRGMMKRGFNL